MKQYKLINNITGWIVFTLAAITYLLTIEPTASLWDCGEFIASGFKLEVGHPPGNPVFMIMARFFTLFAGGNVSHVAAMVNSMSALASAFTILFLFWTITHLARKILMNGDSSFTTSRIIAVIAAGVVGSLAFTFSDSFWFSAVEGEVYASSSFFTAIVFWAILKWEDNADSEYADRWLILIAFLMGLSIGVHLLNLLTLPAIFLVYYFRKYEFTWKGFVIAISSSFVILALLMWGIMPGVVTISTKFELFFVNTLGLPPNTGMIVHVVILAALFVMAIRSTLRESSDNVNSAWAIGALFFTGVWVVSGSGFVNIIILLAVSGLLWYISSQSRKALNTILTALVVVLIGYSSNAIIVIRSNANTPLNENNPSNAFNLRYFLNREQYGQSPLLKGQYYNAPVTDYKDGKPVYALENGKYVITHRNKYPVYDERFTTILPRMWSDQEDHAQVYREWGGTNGTPITVTDPSTGEKTIIRKPTFGENLKFMFSYQFGYMYFRYFMWNFAGKQNDTQGTGGAMNGNWISGINFLDAPRTGSSDIPEALKKDTSRNKYFLLPLLLGLAGLFYQLNRDNKNWWNIFILFVMTGIAIVIYLNQYPNQPRERDYAYVGSFYFFAVWIGLGVLSLYELLSKAIDEKYSAPAAGLICLVVPVLMGSQNWDDHDRSGRYLARDVAFNYLNSCAEDAILFTNGDNDTFPLWYAQEVEGMRTDVRVCNLMLLNTDWYIDQMKRTTYKSKPLPISLPVKKYYDGINNQVFVFEKTKDPVDISTVIDWVNSENKATKVQVSAEEVLDVLPTRTIRIPVDRKKVIESGTVKAEDSAKIVPYIDIKLKGSSILKSQLLVLDILAHNNWERPIYFVTGYHSDAMGLEEYFRLEGLAYRFVPVKTDNNSWLDYGGIDTDILYDNMMNKFVWGGANDPKVNIDYHHYRTLIVVKARLNHARLAKKLAAEGKNEKAAAVLDHCMEILPLEKIPYDPYMPDVIDAYFASGQKEKAIQMSKDFCDYQYQLLDYYFRQTPYVVSASEFEIQTAIQYSSRVANSCSENGNKELSDEINKKLEGYYSEYLKSQQPGALN